MEFKGTKGEWKREYDNADSMSGGCWFDIGPAKVEFSYHSTKEEEEEALANAKLIAAAPDLLKALQILLELTTQVHHPSIDYARGAAQNAISKALK